MKSAWAGDGDGEETSLRSVFSGRNFGTLEPGGGARGGSRRGLAGRHGTAAALQPRRDSLERLRRQYVVSEVRASVLPALVVTVVFRPGQVRFVSPAPADSGRSGWRGGRRRVTGSARLRRFVSNVCTVAGICAVAGVSAVIVVIVVGVVVIVALQEVEESRVRARSLVFL